MGAGGGELVPGEDVQSPFNACPAPPAAPAGWDWTLCLAQRGCPQIFVKYHQPGAGDPQPLTGQVLPQKVAEAAALVVTEENGSSW